MKSLALIRAQVEGRIPGALTPYMQPALEVMLTGASAFDIQTGGIPKGALTQICAPGWSSSGKTTLLLSLMAQTTSRGEFCALVDGSHCFDPVSADVARVDLQRVLWVRCAEKRSLRPLEQAFRAADILIQNGGFGLIAVDLGSHEAKAVRKIPLTTWFRFARVIEKMRTALVFLSPVPGAQSCAALTVHLACNGPRWQRLNTVSHGQLLDAVEFQADIARARVRKPVQSVRPKFTATSQWA
jgi:recombination protein RecA